MRVYLLLACRGVVREEVAPLEEGEEELHGGRLVRVGCAEADGESEPGYGVARYLRGVVAGAIKQ